MKPGQSVEDSYKDLLARARLLPGHDAGKAHGRRSAMA